MSKVTGSYESFIRGVSEQVPHDRFVGQHWAQDNMVSDPVRGLARRQGSRMLTEKLMSGVVNNAATQQDFANYKEFSFTINSVEYSLLYRPGTKVVGSTASPLVCVRKSDGVILDVQTLAADNAAVVAALDGGLSAVGNMAKYLIMAPNNRVPTVQVTDAVDYSKNLTAVWVRQGAYSRTYSITLTRTDGTQVTASYTTPTSYYTGTLNTSDIPATATDYQKQVNDRVYAYQTAVNQWIASSAAAIQPQAIAQSLLNALPAGEGTRVGSHLLFGSHVNVSVDDGGDGTYMKGVAQEVQSANDLCPIHSALGIKVVRIRPKGSTVGDNSGVYYVVAKPKDGVGALAWKEVIWEEAPGMYQAPQFVTLLGQIIGNNLYVATSQANLQTLTGDSNQTPWGQATSGDLDSMPTPAFFGQKITYIGAFQDRLMLVSGSTVNLSKSGDYFNFFRQSALTIADDDPVEMFALGSNGDTITDAAMVDRSLILFGKQYQYAMDGRNILTPRSAYIAIQSANEDSTTCPPAASGNFIFFSQLRNNRLTVQQMQTGDYVDSFRAFDITTQLDGYLKGTPRQILALTSPSWLVVRTKENANGFWTFSYLDSADQTQRLFDSWSKWSFDPSLGQLIGITGSDGNILAVTCRTALDGTRYVVDQFVRDAYQTTNPHIDSWRPYTNTTGSIRPGWAGQDVSAIVYNGAAADNLYLVGDLLENYTAIIGLGGGNANAIMGTLFESSVEPTAPYMRDQKDKAILDCRLTLGSYRITLSNTAAIRAYLRGFTDPIDDEQLILDWIYRPAGTWVLNTQQVANTVTVPIHVLKEIREHRLRLASRNWLPMTISAVEWAGQFFTQRRS